MPLPPVALLAFSLSVLTSDIDGLHQWTLVPGQVVIKGVAQVRNAPGDDDAVIQANQDAHLGVDTVGLRDRMDRDGGPGDHKG